MQREILWTLEEAGEEEIATILNLLRSQIENATDEELEQLAIEAINRLRTEGLVQLGGYRYDSRRPRRELTVIEAEQLVPSLPAVIKYDAEMQRWATVEIPDIVLTLILTPLGQEAITL
jgi:hypothetical protein